MATITYDKTTNGKHRARWTDGFGEHEEFLDTHEEAQAKINHEMAYKLWKLEGTCPWGHDCTSNCRRNGCPCIEEHQHEKEN